MDTFRTIFPYLLAAYFIARGWKQRIYLLGIPFLMLMGPSVFFNTAKLFYTPGSWDRNVHVLLWLFLTWLYATNRIPFLTAGQRDDLDPRGNRRFTVVEFPYVLLLLILLFNVFVNTLDHGRLDRVIDEAVGPLTLLAGYFILRDIFAHSSRSDIEHFLGALVVVNTIAAVLFILHQGLHFKIYIVEEYLSTSFRGELITRTFWIMPVFFPMAVIYSLTRGRLRPLDFVVVSINVVGIFLSYTRSLAVSALLLVVLLYLFQARKSRKLGALLKRYALLSAGAVVMFVIILRLFPIQAEYFAERVRPLLSSLDSEGTNSLLVRSHDAFEVFKRIDSKDVLLGVGFPSKTQNPEVVWVEKATTDSVWTSVVFRFGVIGLALFFLLYLVALRRMYRAYLAADGDSAFLLLLIFLVTLDGLLQSFTSWAFMIPGRYPMGLWYLSLAAVEFNRTRIVEGSMAPNEALDELQIAADVTESDR